MEGIVLVIALIGSVYVFGRYSSDKEEIEKNTATKDRDNISETLINILKQKRNIYLVKILLVSIMIFMVTTNFLYTEDQSITYLLSVIVACVLVKEYEEYNIN